jgi:hypothetical protein
MRVECVVAATAPVLAHVLGIVHVAASHAVRVGPLSDVDRPLAVARYSAVALDSLGDVPARLTDCGHGKRRSFTESGVAERVARVWAAALGLPPPGSS